MTLAVPAPGSVGASVWRDRLVRLVVTAGLGSGIVALAALIGWASDYGGPFAALSGPNAYAYDLAVAALQETGLREPWKRSLVLLLDEESLAQPPWSLTPRALHQPLLGNLARDLLDMGARKVALDLVVAMDPGKVSIPGADLSTFDSPLRQILNDEPDRIVLGAYPTVAPAAAYADLLGAGGVGVVDLQAESDGIIRSVATRVRTPTGSIEPAFAELVAAPPDGDISIRPQSRVLIFPPVPLTRMPSLNVASYGRCLASAEGRRQIEAAIRGRNVLIGAAVAGEDVRRGPDRFMRPMPVSPPASECEPTTLTPSPTGRNIVPGVVIQAAAVEAAMSENNADLAPPSLRALGSALATGIGLALFVVAGRRLDHFPARRPRIFSTTIGAFATVIALTVALALAFLGVEVAALRLWHFWLPLGHTLVLVSAVGLMGTMSLAVRRDLALADLRTAFGRYLPPPVVAAALARRDAFDGEERTISVLMADLRGFTPFCGAHRNEPTQIIRALNQKFAAAQEILDHHGACLDKFDGDAVIAFWNGVGDQPDHAARAIAAAVELVERDRIAVAEGREKLAFKVAVATGIAFVGSYGSRQKRSFSAIGEPMNLASRLEGACNHFKTDILIAEETAISAERNPAGREEYRQLLATHRLVRLGSIDLKGFGRSIPVLTVRESETPSPM